MYALTHCTLYTGYQQLQHHALVVKGDRIVDLIPEAQLPFQIDRVDGQGLAAAPGFIDLQLNGCGGVMFNDAITPATLDIMHHTNLKSGTTSFLPTLITTNNAAMESAMAVVQDYRQVYPDRVLGLHLEGPYLNPQRRGIHDPTHIRPAETTMVEHIVAMGPGVVRLVTLAPEMVEEKVVKQLSEAGIVVSAGHSDATFEQALAGFDRGVTMVTHLFNAMSPWLGRSPGLVGATFSRPEVYAGIIADGHHVHYGSLRLAKAIKGNRLILVSDATPPVGTTLSSFMIGGQEVFYQNGRCVSADGTLGGSALTLMEAVQNCVVYGGLDLAEALRMASLYPAQALGLDHSLGLLQPGYRANIVLFNAQNFRVERIIDHGQCCLFNG
jgi:N-acetylglucosamine-6-phosphate deacetylase